MSEMRCIILIFLGITFACGKEFVVQFNRNNVTGFISFNQPSIGAKVNVTIQLSGVKIVSLGVALQPAKLNFNVNCPQPNDKLNYFLKVTQLTYSTTNITLYGSESIFGGNAFLFGGNDNKKPLACGTILSGDDRYLTAQVSSSRVTGFFEFTQNIEDGTSTVIMYGNILPSSGITDMKNYTFFLSDKSTKECFSIHATDTATVFGPYKAGHALSEKTDLLPSSLHDKLIVITNENNETVACGQIITSGPLQVASVFEKDKHQGVSGKLVFRQISPFHPTSVTIELNGLANRTSGYHVHQFPISDKVNPCSPQSVGGHWNPFGINPKTSRGTWENFELGDLSRKYGSLSGRESFDLVVKDGYLPMFSLHSLIGRSIVIHNDDLSNSRFVCSNILPEGGMSIGAIVNFTANQNSALNGVVSMSQYILQSGVKTQTMFVVKLNYKADAGKTTKNHNFHVHVARVGNDGSAGICSSVLGHYNPFNVSVKQPVYSAQCSPQTFFRCELGDTSNKVGTYDVGLGKAFYVDQDCPLYGKQSVLARSITFHTEEKGGPRLACADIEPIETVRKMMFTLSFKDAKYKIPDKHKSQIEDLQLKLMSMFTATVDVSFDEVKNVTAHCFEASFTLTDKSKDLNGVLETKKILEEIRRNGRLYQYLICSSESCNTNSDCSVTAMCESKRCVCKEGYKMISGSCKEKITVKDSLHPAAVVVPCLVLLIVVCGVVCVVVRRVRS